MVLLVALAFAFFSFIAIKAGKKGIGLTAGLVAFLIFIGWLASGPGFAFLDFLENPTAPELPDSVPIPGR